MNTTTTFPLPSNRLHVVAVEFRAIAINGERQRVEIDNAADFFIKHYSTHKATRFQWDKDADFSTIVHMRWQSDPSGKVTIVHFDDCSRSRWATTTIANPVYLEGIE